MTWRNLSFRFAFHYEIQFEALLHFFLFFFDNYHSECQIAEWLVVMETLILRVTHATYYQGTVLQFSKDEGWTKLYPHLSCASDHLIIQCFTSLKPPYIVGPVCFGMIGYVFVVILTQDKLQNLPFCASKWIIIKYIGWILSNHVQINYSKSNWS